MCACWLPCTGGDSRTWSSSLNNATVIEVHPITRLHARNKDRPCYFPLSVALGFRYHSVPTDEAFDESYSNHFHGDVKAFEATLTDVCGGEAGKSSAKAGSQTGPLNLFGGWT